MLYSNSFLKKSNSSLLFIHFGFTAQAKKHDASAAAKDKAAKAEKKLATLQARLDKKQILKIDKEENKTIALGTSKLNYLDPRISVSWCKRNGVPIEKVILKHAFVRGFCWVCFSLCVIAFFCFCFFEKAVRKSRLWVR